MSEPKKFPWLPLLFSSIFWAVLTMAILGALIIYFGREGLTETQKMSEIIAQYFKQGLNDTFLALIVLIPCFYAGMGACVLLEKRDERYENQFETLFRVASTLCFLGIFAIVVYVTLFPLENATTQDALSTIRLLVIFYIFDANVIDRVWPDVFESRS